VPRIVTRILSDVHLGHKASLVADPAALAPLVRGAQRLVFNGDTVEQKYGDSPKRADDPPPALGAVGAATRAAGADPVYITGNHDPLVSNLHYALEADGRILVTHGDGLFPDIAPWSSNLPKLRAALQKIPEPLDRALHAHLARVKLAAQNAHLSAPDYDPTVWGKIHMTLHQGWPPTRPLRIIRCWRQTPAQAVAFARRFGFDPQIVFVGHTHWPGVWRSDGVWVVNTGSLMFWPPALMADIEGDRVTIRRVRKRRDRFRPGPVVRTIALR